MHIYRNMYICHCIHTKFFLLWEGINPADQRSVDSMPMASVASLTVTPRIPRTLQVYFLPHLRIFEVTGMPYSFTANI